MLVLPWKTASSSSREASELNRLSLMKTIKTMANIFIFLVYGYIYIYFFSCTQFQLRSDQTKFIVSFNWIGVFRLNFVHSVHFVGSEKVELNSTSWIIAMCLICLLSSTRKTFFHIFNQFSNKFNFLTIFFIMCTNIHDCFIFLRLTFQFLKTTLIVYLNKTEKAILENCSEKNYLN